MGTPARASRAPMIGRTRRTPMTSLTPLTPVTAPRPVTPIAPRSIAIRPVAAEAASPTGDQLLEIAAAHLSEEYALGARAPLANARWTGPWDCAEFASWCVYQAAGVLYGTEPRDDPIRADACSGFWAAHAEGEHTLIPLEQAARTPGACVLRRPGANGMGHIAFSDGNGGTIEAHSRIRGVVRDALSGRRWDYGILVPGVQYFANEHAIEVKLPERVLRLMRPLMRGPTVRAVQEALTRRGYHPGSVDGVYGPQTAYAVQSFQSDEGLVPDGEAGPKTLQALGTSDR